MKKNNLFFGIGVIGLAILFNSCGDKEVGLAPSITFDDGAEIVLAEGENSTAVTGSIVAEEKLNQVTVFTVIGTDETQIGTYSSFSSGDITTTDDLNYNFRITVTGINQDMSLKIEAVDKEAQSSTKSISLKVTSAPALKAEFTAILMGGQDNVTYGSCLDANTGLVYKITGGVAKTNAPLIDILYYYGSSNLATLAAPNDPTVDGTGAGSFDWTGTWSIKNATKFAESTLDYSAVTSGEVNAITGLSASLVTNLTVGKVIAFQTADSKKGVLKVTALTTGGGGTITLSVKVQE